MFNRELSSGIAEEKGLIAHAERTLFLMKGEDLSREIDFGIRR